MPNRAPGISPSEVDQAGRRFASLETKTILEAHGLGDLDAVFANRGECIVRHKQRMVFRRRLTGGDGESTTVFVKLHWGDIRPLARWDDLLAGRILHSCPSREWLGLQRIASLGYRVPRRLAWFDEGVFRFRAAVILEQIPPRSSLQELLSSPRWNRFRKRQQLALIDELTAMVARIDAAGLFWKGLACKHIFPRLRADHSWELWLIDCEGVKRRPAKQTLTAQLRKLQQDLRRCNAEETFVSRFGDRCAALLQKQTCTTTADPRWTGNLLPSGSSSRLRRGHRRFC